MTRRSDMYDLTAADCPPPRYARVRVVSPAFEFLGQTYPGQLDWVDTLYVASFDCDHQSSICRDVGCLTSWLLDHDVELPDGEEFPADLPEHLWI